MTAQRLARYLCDAAERLDSQASASDDLVLAGQA